MILPKLLFFYLAFFFEKSKKNQKIKINVLKLLIITQNGRLDL